ncbi:glutathione S-transferase [Phaeosphaeriaceae sp. SRC1lsM3a]|nr:glutathione S-transferase [Stagonospora sp. SRC1lsM3a]
MSANGEVVTGDLDYDGRLILYIIKADQTSYINYIKPLILAEELQCPYIVSVIKTTDEWYSAIHPERYVPALKDFDAETQKDVVVFESTACLQYIADKFDSDGTWKGRNAWEKGQILSWTAYQTAGLGATAKYWLYFLKGFPTRENPDPPMRAVDKLHANVLKQWDILEQRLLLPGQNYIALPDRPTIADISYFPFAMPWMFMFLGVNVKDWPGIEAWGKRMVERSAVKTILERGPKYGH